MKSYSDWVRQAIAVGKRQTRDIVSFFDSSVPEPRELLRKTISDAVTPDFSRYVVSAFNGGNPFVLDALAERYGVGHDRILCTTGATSALSLIFRTFAGPGDHVLIETPGFDLFAALIAETDAKAEYFERTGERYTIDLDDLAARLTPHTKLIVLTNLHNPSGMALDHDLLNGLADLAERNGILVVVDEVYGDYADEDMRPCPACAISPALISVSSLTKSFGLATLRCGWVVGAASVVQRLQDFAGQVEFGLSNFAHALAAHVLCDPAPFRAYADELVTQSRARIEPWFRELKAQGMMAGALPDAGCIFFPQLPGIADTAAFSSWMIERHGVIVAPGEYFGRLGHVRIGFAQHPDRLEAGLAALEAGIVEYTHRQGSGARAAAERLEREVGA